eukprot:NODE_249_length_11770_cov_0.803530.p7 type:complete len:128 gc:universal NODE_249_length_11770_cov_0.803530:1299-916(-)
MQVISQNLKVVEKSSIASSDLEICDLYLEKIWEEKAAEKEAKAATKKSREDAKDKKVATDPKALQEKSNESYDSTVFKQDIDEEDPEKQEIQIMTQMNMTERYYRSIGCFHEDENEKDTGDLLFSVS